MKASEYRAEVSKVLFMLGEVFGGEISDLLVDAWVGVFGKECVTIPELRDAAIQVMGTRRYNKIPPPAELLDIIRPRVDHRVTAEAQADLVLEAVRSVGPYKLPDFEDTITHHLMTTRWGWRGFASNLESDQIKWWRRDFAEAYQSMADSGEVKRLPAPGGKSDKQLLEEINAHPVPSLPGSGDPPTPSATASAGGGGGGCGGGE